MSNFHIWLIFSFRNLHWFPLKKLFFPFHYIKVMQQDWTVFFVFTSLSMEFKVQMLDAMISLQFFMVIMGRWIVFEWAREINVNSWKVWMLNQFVEIEIKLRSQWCKRVCGWCLNRLFYTCHEESFNLIRIIRTIHSLLSLSIHPCQHNYPILIK